jgi:hypothetical protein
MVGAGRVTAGAVALFLTAAGTTARAEEGRVKVRIGRVRDRQAVERAAGGGRQRLREPECRSVLADFDIGQGRTLAQALEALGPSPEEYLAWVFNDDPSTMLTVWGANCGLSTIGSVRLALEPKPDLPTDPDDPREFIDVFTDIRGLFVINNESGWYEGWMIHDLRVADVVPPDEHGRPPFGKIKPVEGLQGGDRARRHERGRHRLRRRR